MGERNRIQGKGDNDSIRLVGATKGPIIFSTQDLHTHTHTHVWVVTCCSSSFSLSLPRVIGHTRKKEKIAVNKTRDFVSFFSLVACSRVLVVVVWRWWCVPTLCATGLDCDGTILDLREKKNQKNKKRTRFQLTLERLHSNGCHCLFFSLFLLFIYFFGGLSSF